MFFNFLLYADDTTLFCNLEDIDSDYKEFKRTRRRRRRQGIYTKSGIATRP